MKKTLLSLAIASVALGAPVSAELVYPSLSYRTGPFAVGGIPFADGYADYFTLINERDGGIGGEMAKVLECETAYNTEKGVECYEATKDSGSLLYQPLSTGITYQLIPKAEADGIPILSSGYGRTSAKNGKVFRHTFNFPVNYWDGASIGINHFKEQAGGSLEGKKVTLLHFNGAYGKEPIRTLQELSKMEGFEFNTIPIDYPGQEQKSQWLQIRRERPDYILFWGWGVMNQVAVQEASNIRFPMENFMGIWWSGAEQDVLPAGDGANGYKSLQFQGVGSDYPLYDDMKKYVVDAGKAAGDGSNVGSVIYNRGLYAAFLAHQITLDAQEMNGTSSVTPAMMRDAMEQFTLTAADYEAAGLGGFGPDIKVSCENHGGLGTAAITQWDASAQKWSLITDYMPSNYDLINKLVMEDSMQYAAENNITPNCD
jgi:branched-chain amino acid transport system substrate-binding protein